MSSQVDITDYVAGDSLEIDFTVLQSDGTVFPSLNTCTISWKLDQVAPLGPGANLLTKTLGQGVTLVSAPDGTVTVVINEGEVPAIGAMTHALVVTTGSGAQYTVAKGEFVAQASL
jgi:hypothetical protein